MKNDYHSFWEKCWREEKPGELEEYLSNYFQLTNNEIDFFKENKIVNICDAACGFGAYSLAFASNGFNVSGFDISETAVNMTKKSLEKYGLASDNIKVASILDTGYENGIFDGAVAHAVLDHLSVADAGLALEELIRIIRDDGLLMLSFDMAEDDDLTEPHIMPEAGTMQYTTGTREGMLFHPYEWNEIEELLSGLDIVYRKDHGRRERVVIVRK